MLNAVMENKNKIFANISCFLSEFMVTDHGNCDHDLRKEIKILVKSLFFYPP